MLSMIVLDCERLCDKFRTVLKDRSRGGSDQKVAVQRNIAVECSCQRYIEATQSLEPISNGEINSDPSPNSHHRITGDHITHYYSFAFSLYCSNSHSPLHSFRLYLCGRRNHVRTRWSSIILPTNIPTNPLPDQIAVPSDLSAQNTDYGCSRC